MAEYVHAEAVTPSDTDNLPGGVADGLLATGAGNYNVLLEADTTAVVIVSPGANQILSGVRVKRVLSTSTTCTGIKALYSRSSS